MFQLDALLQIPLLSLHLRQIHCHILTNFIFFDRRDLFLSRLLRRCSAASDFPYAYRLLSQIRKPSIHLWDSLVGHFSDRDTLNPHLSFLAYVHMRRIGVIPSRHTFPPLLKTISRLRHGNPFQFHAHVIKFGLGSDNFVGNSLVSAYSNCGHVEYGWCVFDANGEKDVVSWTAMIDGFVRNDLAVEAMKCFVEMKKTGIMADEMTVVSVLSAAAMAGDIRFGRTIHGFYVETGRVKWDVFVGSSLVDMYGKCGCCDDARKLFDEMPYRNVVTWTAMIAGYVQCQNFKDGLSVFQEMLKGDIKPNEQTITSVLSACSQLGALHQGRWVHAYMDKNSIEMNANVGTALIDMYAKCGCLHEAVSVFEKLSKKNVYTWTAMINGLAMHGDASGALDLFQGMLQSHIPPNEVTFVGVLSACAHGGLVEEGKNLFESMKQEHGLDPNADHYGCLVDLLGRKGLLEEAMDLIKRMPMKPTNGIWGALFASCMTYKDYKLGEYIGWRLIELQPYHSGRHALLANLYSESQSWDTVARVRKLMKDQKVGKPPGCSWVQVGGAVREFVAFDKSHCESADLYRMLDIISMQMRPTGCDQDLKVLAAWLEVG